MDFSLNEQQEMMVKTSEDFASKEIRPKIREIEKLGVKELREKVYDLGLFGVEFPEDCGGAGLGTIERGLILEKFAEKGDGGATYSIFYPLLSIYISYELVEDKKLTSELIQGAKKIALAKCGLYPDVIKSVGKDSRLVIEDKYSKFVFFFAQDGDDYSLYITDNFEIVRELFRSGLLSSPANEIVVKSSEKLVENVTRHKNWINFLARVKIFLSAICVGICKGVSDYALEYALDRVAFERPIAYHQAISFMLADMDTLSQSLEVLLYKAAYSFDKKKENYEDTVTELFIETSETGRKIVADAVQILGGHGYIKDHPTEKWMRDFVEIINAFGSPIYYEGTIKNLESWI